MARIPIALQLYSVRDACAKDFPGTLESVAKMGYEGVEFAGYYDYTAVELKKMLDTLGMKCCGTHTGIDTLLGDQLERTIDFNKALDNRFLIVPALPEQYRTSKQEWLNTAKIFNELAGKIKERGMVVGYHNHMIEFQELEGEMPWDIFFSNTHESVVMQIDTGNALHGGADAAPLIKKYPGRAITVHLKEYAKDNEVAVVGEGDVKWNDVFEACETVGGTEWYIVEQEKYGEAPLACAEGCINNLKKMGK